VSDATTTRSGLTVHPTHNGLVQVHITAQRLQSVTLISTWASGIEALTRALQSALGCAPPSHTGQAAVCDMGLLLRSGPLEFMLIGAHAAPDRVHGLRTHVPAQIGSVLDLSHARIRVQVQGEKAVDALAKLYALDFRPVAFPTGRFKLTGHHHIPCMLHRLESQRFDLYFLTTYAHGQIDALMDVALEYGVELNGI